MKSLIPCVSVNQQYLETYTTYIKRRKDDKRNMAMNYFWSPNTVTGLSGLVKKSWTIVDDAKTDYKERMKAMSLIMQCYDKKLEPS